MKNFNFNKTVTDKNFLKKNNGASSMKIFKEAGYKPLEGYQLRYVYFIDKCAKENLTVPIIPFSKLKEMGIGMYKGEKLGIDGVYSNTL